MTQIPEPKNETQPETPLLGSSSLIRERKEVLLGLFQENRTHVRHHESQKTTATNIVLLTTVGLIGLIKELTYKDWPLTVAVILVGVFGAAFNANEHQEIRRYKARARAYFDALDELLFKGAVRTLQSIRDKPDDVPNPQFSKSQRITVWRLVQLFWPLAISLIAVGFTIYMYYWMPHNQ